MTRHKDERKPKLFTAYFWYDTAERAIKSAAQGFLLSVGSDAIGWTALDWRQIAAATCGMGVLSLAMNVAGVNMGTKGTSSWIKKK